MACSFDSCDNQVFKDLNECALHCTKNNYQVDRNSGLLSEFNELLKKFVTEDICDGASAIEIPHIELFLRFIDGKLSHEVMQEESFNLYNDQSNDDVVDIDEILSNNVFIFSGFHFPTRDGRDSYDYLKWLKYVGSIHFMNCFFYLRALDLKDTKTFFDSCTFEEEFSFSPMSLLENTYDTIFSHCNFNKNFEIAPSSDKLEDNSYQYRVLYNCKYLDHVTLRNSIFNEEVFYREKNSDDNFPIGISFLEVIDCIFEEKFKINYSKITNLKISNSHFKSKFEIKNGEVDCFEFEDSNVEGIFDAYKSVFTKAKFYKSIFKEFAAFEYVVFGDDKKSNITDFIYTTFKDFSNFRNTRFISGLNFSTVNLKQEPNFLNAYIQPKGTDRETFRIIKNSFEKNNNKIEANRFFVHEMNAYREEIRIFPNVSIILCRIKALKKYNIVYFFEVLAKYTRLIKVNIFNFRNYRWSKVKFIYKLISLFIRNVISCLSVFFRNFIVNANYYISGFGTSYIRPFTLLLLSVALYTYLYQEYQKNLRAREYALPYNLDLITEQLNTGARNFLPFARFVSEKSGFEFISLLFYILFGVLIWQTIVAVKRHTQN